MNNLDINHLRIEIAYLQEEIESANPPTKAKFKIPVIMTEDRVTSLVTSNKNILNRSNGNISGSPIHLDNTIELPVPLEYTYFYGADKVPKDTRFLVAFVGANVNDIKIIGRYDSARSNEISSLTVINNTMSTYNDNVSSINKNYKEINSQNAQILEDLKIIEQYARDLEAVRRELGAVQKELEELKNNSSGGGTTEPEQPAPEPSNPDTDNTGGEE